MTPPLKIYPCPVCSHTMAGWPGTSQVRLAVPALTRGVRSGKFSFWDCCNHAEAVLKQFEYGATDTAEYLIQVWNAEAVRLLATDEGSRSRSSEEHRRVHRARLGISL